VRQLAVGVAQKYAERQVAPAGVAGT
jgi:hypothetical protein